ncbi:MAG TPA: hypothetical protein VD866_29150 [Urbifossiella sp.]|nr:hypothetical protein [Urbifossiella sp.]
MPAGEKAYQWFDADPARHVFTQQGIGNDAGNSDTDRYGDTDWFMTPAAGSTNPDHDAGLRVVSPSNLLVRVEQAAAWADRLSAPGQPVTHALYYDGDEYVRLILPDSARDTPNHDRIAAAFGAAGLPNTTDGPLAQAVRALYRGNVTTPTGYPDRYLVMDPETGVAYVSSVPDFGLSRLTGDLSRVREYRLTNMVRDGLAQKVGDSFYVAWVDLPAGQLHRIVMEPYGSQIVVPGENGDPSIPEEATISSHTLYRPVFHLTAPLGTAPAADVFANINTPTAAANALAAVAARREGQALDLNLRLANVTLNGVQIAARVTPVVGAVIYALEGETREALISAGGDLTLIFGIGVATKAIQGGRTVRAVLVASAAYDLTVAVYRGAEGVGAIQNEDYIGAASRFGQAGLHLIGLGLNTSAYLKAAGKARAEARLAADVAAREAAAESAAKAAALATEAVDGGHSLTRHGPELTNDVLRRRVTEGVAPGGGISPQQHSTQFKDYQTWTRTRDAAIKQMEADPLYRAVPGPGDQTRFAITIHHSEVIGSGFRGREGTNRTIVVGGKNVKVYDEVDPIVVYRVTTTIEWDAALSRWKIVQHYPDGRLPLVP